MIRPAVMEDYSAIQKIFAAAREFMRTHGNPTQWGTTSPEEELWLEDIRRGDLYIVEKNSGVHGVFALIFGEDPTYSYIEGGAWRSDAPYATLHRVASDGQYRGIFEECIAFSKSKYSHLRIDTHADNLPMQHLAEKHGFVYCGVIYVHNGTSPRKAYEYIAEE
ncbi:MAG: GNAT family N-acetyltransferase [Clostridia bacterium]|nr:GNAT family N-acetyltransferase [Clostridia bacterium]